MTTAIAAWIALNVLCVAATGVAGNVFVARWLRSRAALRRASEGGARGSVVLMARRNVRWAAIHIATNLALGLLGVGLIATAVAWAQARRPLDGYAVPGTAVFAAIWIGWMAATIWDWRVLEQVTALAEREAREGC